MSTKLRDPPKIIGKSRACSFQIPVFFTKLLFFEIILGLIEDVSKDSNTVAVAEHPPGESQVGERFEKRRDETLGAL